MNDAHENETSGADDVFVADPADMEYYDEPELPKWPKVVGIISIVYAALGLICGGVGTAWIVAQPRVMGNMASEMEGGVPPAMLQTNPMLLTVAGVGLAWAALLLVAGIMCTLRKATTRPLSLVYAVGAVLLTVWSTSIQLDMQAEIAQWFRDNPDAEFTQVAGGGGQQAGNVVGTVLGVAFGVSWPAFLLFWFGFVKTKPDDLTGGVDVEVI